MELPIQTEDEMKLIENLLINESNIKNLVSHPFQATFQSKITKKKFFYLFSSEKHHSGKIWLNTVSQ
jgi:ABC-type transport system involved in Fe-S cluster assembly fused permease/ATPase subunit